MFENLSPKRVYLFKNTSFYVCVCSGKYYFCNKLFNLSRTIYDKIVGELGHCVDVNNVFVFSWLPKAIPCGGITATGRSRD